MDERRANNDTIAACFAHIVLLRKELQWIGDTTKDPETKLQVAHTLSRSLAMPPSTE
jgi:hypothetical protein